jgi:hypothetical protein
MDMESKKDEDFIKTHTALQNSLAVQDNKVTEFVSELLPKQLTKIPASSE